MQNAQMPCTHTREWELSQNKGALDVQDGKRLNLIMGVHTGILQQQVDSLSKAAVPQPIMAK